MEFDKEVYKELRGEYKQFIFLIHKLWSYKFAVVGSVITIAVFHEDILGIEREIGLDLTIFGLIALPIISLLIDLKAFEIGLHIKTISDFLSENFSEIQIVQAWEKHKWTSKASKRRSIINFITSVGTSILILIICFTMIGTLKPEWIGILVLGGVIMSIIPIAVGTIFYYRIWKSIENS